MAAEAVIFQVPAILYVLCYLSGMSIYLGVLVWLFPGRKNRLGLWKTAMVYLVRTISAVALFSMVYMIASGEARKFPGHLLPEVAIFLLVFAFYRLMQPDKTLTWKEIIMRHLPAEAVRTAGTLLATISAWIFSIALGWALFGLNTSLGGPEFLPPFVLGVLWLGALPALYRAEKERSVKFHQVLSPVLLAFFLLLLPGWLDHIANSPKIDKLLHTPPPLQRI